MLEILSDLKIASPLLKVQWITVSKNDEQNIKILVSLYCGFSGTSGMQARIQEWISAKEKVPLIKNSCKFLVYIIAMTYYSRIFFHVQQTNFNITLK